MNTDDVVKLLIGLINKEIPKDNKFIGKVCVIRTDSAGVHIGEVVSIDGKQCELKNSRRLWKWSGAFTLSEVARIGIDPTRSRMSVEVGSTLLTEAIELIITTEKAQDTYRKTTGD